MCSQPLSGDPSRAYGTPVRCGFSDRRSAPDLVAGSAAVVPRLVTLVGRGRGLGRSPLFSQRVGGSRWLPRTLRHVVSLARGNNHANPTVVSRFRGGRVVGRAGDGGALSPRLKRPALPGAGVTVAGGNGQGAAANQLNEGLAVAVDATGNVYVADANNYRVQRWAPGATSGVTVAGGNGAGPAANQLSDAYGRGPGQQRQRVRRGPRKQSGATVDAGRDQRSDRRRWQRRRSGSQPTQPAARE